MKKILIPILLLISFFAKAQVPALNDTVRYGTNLPQYNPQFNYGFYQGLRLPYSYNSALGKTDLWVTGAYLRKYYLNYVTAIQYGAKGDSLTNDQAKLQAYLNTGQGVYIFPKGVYKITGLDVPSNSTLLFEQGARLFLADSSNRPALQNVHYQTGIDSNIVINGLYLNGNDTRQIKVGITSPYTGEYTSGIRFFGVKNLRLENITIYHAKTFAAWLNRITNLYTNNILFQQTITGTPANQDGLHINGPATNLNISNITGATNDDMIAFNADDGALGSWVTSGDITNVLLNGVIFNNALNGVRILSATHAIDQIVIKNLSGTIRDNAIAYSAYGLGTGKGGSLIIDGVDVKTNTYTSFSMGEYGGYILLNDSIKYVKISNVHHIQGNDYSRPTIRIQGRAKIGTLTAENINTVIDSTLSDHNPAISFESGGNTQRAFIANQQLLHGTFGVGYGIGLTGAFVGKLNLSNIYEEAIGYGLYLNNSTVNFLFADNLTSNNMRWPIYAISDSHIGVSSIAHNGWYCDTPPNVYYKFDTSTINIVGQTTDVQKYLYTQPISGLQLPYYSKVDSLFQKKALTTFTPFNGTVAAGDSVQRALEKLQYQASTSITSIIGTTNQVIVSGAGSVKTLSLPQDIAQASTPTFAQIIIKGTVPDISMFNTAAGTDLKSWDFINNNTNGDLVFRAVNDAGSNATTWLTVSRVGFVPTLAKLGIPIAVTNFYSTSSTPSIAAGAGAGTSPTISIAGNNQDGIITLTTGTSPAASGTIATITMSGSFAYPNLTMAVLQARNQGSSILTGSSAVITSGTTTTFTIIAGTVALQAGVNYIWAYHNGGN